MTAADTSTVDSAAYGGAGWQPREAGLQGELGSVWAACGIRDEWSPLQSVVMHRPGPEIEASADPDTVQMLQVPDAARAARQHDGLAAAYREAGVAVHRMAPESGERSPNLMFAADLFFATPEGVILARPASRVRAGEERVAARCLAGLGVPIVRTVSGHGTFEGADAMWVSPDHVLIGRGMRTNDAGAAQVAAVLGEMGVTAVTIDLPCGVMHLMGVLRIVDRDLAVAWPGRLAVRGVELLRKLGCRVAFLPETTEARGGSALNFVTLGPREIMMPAGNPLARSFYEGLGIACRTAAVDELAKAAGAVGCLTGILHRRAP